MSPNHSPQHRLRIRARDRSSDCVSARPAAGALLRGVSFRARSGEHHADKPRPLVTESRTRMPTAAAQHTTSQLIA